MNKELYERNGLLDDFNVEDEEEEEYHANNEDS